MKKALFILLLLPLLSLGASARAGEPSKETAAVNKPAGRETASEPKRVEVQHILISFKGAIPNEKVTRAKEEAEVLAKELFERAKAGEDFDTLVKQYTDDQHPGIYRLSNFGVEPDAANQEYPRERMIKAFGDASFSLKVGGIGMAAYDPATSKYGWHIIKRLK